MIGSAIDEYLGWFILACIIGAQLMAIVKSVTENVDVSAFSLVKVANDVCGLSVALLVFILWHTLCYKNNRVKLMMTKGTKFAPNGMAAGGFLPIPAAVSTGLLLFVTGTFVAEAYVGASFLVPGPFCSWIAGKRCRANAVENNDYFTTWFSRFDRGAPVPNNLVQHMINKLTGATEEKKGEKYIPDGTCFAGVNYGTIISDFDESAMTNTTLKGICGLNYCGSKACEDWEKTKFVTEQKSDCIPNLYHPQGEPGRLCMYQCVGWSVFSLRTFLDNSGSIFVGAGIVIWLTEKVSSSFGAAFVTPGTQPEQLLRLFAATSPGSLAGRLLGPFRHSHTFTTVPIVATYAFLKIFLVPRIDSDGFYTVDYYVTFVLLFSAMMVVLLRIWHPFEAHMQAFTEQIWKSGKDQFVLRKDALEDINKYFKEADSDMKIEVLTDLDLLVQVEIDLYTWIHLKRDDRSNMLITYARRPDKALEKGSKLLNIAQEKLTQECEENGIIVNRVVNIESGSDLELVEWIDDTRAKVKTSNEEIVTIHPLKLVESSTSWQDLERDIKDPKYGLNYVDNCSFKHVEARTLVTPLMSDVEAGPQ